MFEEELSEVIKYLSGHEFEVCCSLDVDEFLKRCIEEIDHSITQQTPVQLALSSFGQFQVSPMKTINGAKVIYDSETYCYDQADTLAQLHSIKSQQPRVSCAEKWFEINKLFNQPIVFGLEKVVDSYPAAQHYHYRMTGQLAGILDRGSLRKDGLVEQPSFGNDSHWLTYRSTNDYLSSYFEEVSPEIEPALIKIIESSEGLPQAWSKLNNMVKMNSKLGIKTRILLGKVNAYQIRRLMDRFEIDFLEDED
ncbi:hypothetical protein [Shewanella colwelliana]|uniref:hypothetical protein n=1 Tax=Shewanella colwelliana TaxID=23 RepID=UPI000491FE4E|nr:hypothetical protein [Shewanella colwelliana]